MQELRGDDLDLVVGAGPFSEGDSVHMEIHVGNENFGGSVGMDLGFETMNNMADAVMDMFGPGPSAFSATAGDGSAFSATAGF
jgi:hypothetical protein